MKDQSQTACGILTRNNITRQIKLQDNLPLNSEVSDLQPRILHSIQLSTKCEKRLCKNPEVLFPRNLCDKAIQGCAPAKPGSEPKVEDLRSTKNRFYAG